MLSCTPCFAKTLKLLEETIISCGVCWRVPDIDSYEQHPRKYKEQKNRIEYKGLSPKMNLLHTSYVKSILLNAPMTLILLRIPLFWIIYTLSCILWMKDAENTTSGVPPTSVAPLPSHILWTVFISFCQEISWCLPDMWCSDSTTFYPILSATLSYIYFFRRTVSCYRMHHIFSHSCMFLISPKIARHLITYMIFPHSILSHTIRGISDTITYMTFSQNQFYPTLFQN